MRPAGLALIFALNLFPLLWLPGIAQGRDVVALFSQYLGIISLISMATAQVIATRWPGVEAVFGPLDHSYKLHKWLGITGLVMLLLHDVIDADMRGLGPETALAEAAETAGEISLYGILILVIITIATFIPYNLWKWTHRLIGIFFVMGALHYLFILKPFNNGDPLGLYMALICGLGTLAYAYTSAPRGLRPAQSYEITEVQKTGGATSVRMQPKGRAFKHRAGQFGFFSFNAVGLTEPHPFTISSAPRADGGLRVTVAPLGDLTRRVSLALAVGQTVRVEGPFGHFGNALTGPQIWIAAGVGVTPFLALSEALTSTSGPVTMIYCLKSRETGPHLDELEAIARAKSNFELELWESSARGRFNAEGLKTLVGGLDAHHVLFCGPVAMRRSLSRELPKYGITQNRFHYEEFEIRTGLGLRRLSKWLSGAR